MKKILVYSLILLGLGVHTMHAMEEGSRQAAQESPQGNSTVSSGLTFEVAQRLLASFQQNIQNHAQSKFQRLGGQIAGLEQRLGAAERNVVAECARRGIVPARAQVAQRAHVAGAARPATAMAVSAQSVALPQRPNTAPVPRQHIAGQATAMAVSAQSAALPQRPNIAPAPRQHIAGQATVMAVSAQSAALTQRPNTAPAPRQQQVVAQATAPQQVISLQNQRPVHSVVVQAQAQPMQRSQASRPNDKSELVNEIMGVFQRTLGNTLTGQNYNDIRVLLSNHTKEDKLVAIHNGLKKLVEDLAAMGADVGKVKGYAQQLLNWYESPAQAATASSSVSSYTQMQAPQGSEVSSQKTSNDNASPSKENLDKDPRQREQEVNGLESKNDKQTEATEAAATSAYETEAATDEAETEPELSEQEPDQEYLASQKESHEVKKPKKKKRKRSKKDGDSEWEPSSKGSKNGKNIATGRNR